MEKRIFIVSTATYPDAPYMCDDDFLDIAAEIETEDFLENYLNDGDWEARYLTLPERIAEQDEKKFAFNFAFLKRADWGKLHKIIGVDYYKKNMVEDSEIFYLSEKELKEIGL